MDPPISEVGKWEVGVSAKHEALPIVECGVDRCS